MLPSSCARLQLVVSDLSVPTSFKMLLLYKIFPVFKINLKPHPLVTPSMQGHILATVAGTALFFYLFL